MRGKCSCDTLDFQELHKKQDDEQIKKRGLTGFPYPFYTNTIIPLNNCISSYRFMETNLKKNIQSGKWFSLFCYLFISVNLLIFCYALVFQTTLFHALLREDALIEYLGFFFLLLTSIFLILTGSRYLKMGQGWRALAITFLAVGIVFFWAAGEEISWGQRIFSIKTPQTLSEMNYQNELNIHNINKRLFQQGFRHLTTLLIFISASASYFKRRRIFGILLPDTFLVYSFLLMSAYASYEQVTPEYHLGYLVLVFYLIHYIKKDCLMLLAALSVIALITIVTLVNCTNTDLFQSNNTAEVREYLFSFNCFAYSVLLFTDAKTAQGEEIAY